MIPEGEPTSTTSTAKPARQAWSRRTLGAIAGTAIVVAWQVSNVFSCGRYFVPHVVNSYSEYADYLSGADLYRRHDVLSIKFDCAAIRAPTIRAMNETLTSAMHEALPRETLSDIRQSLVDVGEQEGVLYLRYLHDFDVEALRHTLTGPSKGKTGDALVLRSLYPKIRLTTGMIRTDEIDIVRLTSPCGPDKQ